MSLFLTAVLIGGSAAAAATGIGTGASAMSKNSNALNINNYSSATFDFQKESAEMARDRSNRSLENLGKEKLNILDNSMEKFIETFKRIHNIKMETTLNDLRAFCLDEQQMIEMQKMSSMATSVLKGVVGGAGAGALAAFGAYGATMTFAAASTGTAIASLSGAAATNATLAFLGGGALAAGGGGMALGTAVLGGMTAGPAIAILGIVLNASANKNLDNAYSNKAKSREAIEGMKIIETLCNALTIRADMFTGLLKTLNANLSVLIENLEQVIEKSGTDYSLYSEEEQSIVAMSMSLAGAIKKVLDTPIIDEDGNLTEKSENVNTEMVNFIEDNSLNSDIDVTDKSEVNSDVKTEPDNVTEDTSNPQNKFVSLTGFMLPGMRILKNDNQVEQLTPEEKTIKAVERFICVSNTSRSKLKDKCSKSELERMLRFFKTSEYNETIENIVGLYAAPNPLDALDDKFSGILFMKDKMYIRSRKDIYSVPLRYGNILSVYNKGIINSKMTVSLRTGSQIVLKGIDFTSLDLERLFKDIASYYENNS